MKKNMVIKQAAKVLKIEAEGIIKLAQRIDEKFEKLVDLIFHSKGRLIISGIGKSGLVGRKIVATLNSTGTRAFFLHPAEAMHGDLGMVGMDDIFIALSNSGETEELNVLVPSIRKIGCTIVAMTGNLNSTLARQSNIVIDVGVEKEACPLGLAPTASTTALLAMGDALAVSLSNKKHFKTSDFKKIHPGGALGQRLSMEVKDMMLTGEMVPCVSEGTSLENAVEEINRLELGVTLVVGEDGTLSGIITDGDLRRLIAKRPVISDLNVNDVMTENPRTVGPDLPGYDALNMMEKYQITILPITDDAGKIKGILHLHDILGKGEFKFNGT